MKPTHRQAGFSLMEVMCAILILGVGLAGLTQGLTTALTSSKESEVQTAAALLAAGQIETLRAEGYLTAGTREGVGEEGLSLYRWKQTIANAGIDGLFEVEVVVENSKTGQTIYELRTLLFDPSANSTANETKDRQDRGRGKKREGKRR